MASATGGLVLVRKATGEALVAGAVVQLLASLFFFLDNKESKIPTGTFRGPEKRGSFAYFFPSLD